MKIVRVIFALVLLAGAFWAGSYWRRGQTPAASPGGRKILYWHDPMHPSYRSDKPGIAPDCGMRLEPVYEDGGAAPAAVRDERSVLYYRDPQDPNFRSDKPGLNPETGNELEPVYPDTINVSARKQQWLGVTFVEAQAAGGVREFRAPGKVAFDETRISRVHAKVDGWIDETFVDFTGQRVDKGQKLLSIYSPELFATQQEFLLALRARDTMAGSPLPDARRSSEALVEAARRRLELWDLSTAQITDIANTGKPVRNIVLESPASGFVTARNAFPKQRITPETELYTIADLSRVWIMADVFETDAPLVRVGQAVMVAVAGGRRFAAKVAYIQPQVDAATRTLKVRLETENPGFTLKPDMFVEVDFRVSLPARLSVPAEAVLDTGMKKTVFVDRGNGVIEPREVEIGENFGGRIEVRRGLKPGERVAASGSFLLDSESKLRAPSSPASGAPAAAAPAGGHAHD